MAPHENTPLFDRTTWSSETSGIDFVKLSQDINSVREQLSALLQEQPEISSNTLLQELKKRLLLLVNTYLKCTAQFPSDEQRDLSQMLAWVKQAREAVCPEYSTPIPEAEKQLQLFHLFVEISVIFVIFSEDIGETLQHESLNPLRNVVDTIGTLRISHTEIEEMNMIPGFPLLSEPQQLYAAAMNDTFTLLFDTIEALSSPAEWKNPEIFSIRSKMDIALHELFDIIHFSRDFDRLIKGEISALSWKILNKSKVLRLSLENLLDREDYIRQNQSNIFMRFMLLSSFLQQWSHMDPKDREGLEFEGLLQEVDLLGIGIEALGNVGNDIATFFRELRETFIANSLLADALHQGVITSTHITAAFDELKQMGSEQAKNLTTEISVSVFTGDYLTKKVSLRKQYPQVNRVFTLIDILYENRIFHEAVSHWEHMFLTLQDRFKRSPLARFINMPNFWAKQRNFLYQHLTANQLI